MPWPPQGLYASKPIHTLADLCGLCMRSGNPCTERIARLMGATAVSLPHGTALQAKRRWRGARLTRHDDPQRQREGRCRCGSASNTFYDLHACRPKTMAFVRARLFDALDAPLKEAVLGGAQGAEALGRFGERFALERIKTVGNEAQHIFVPSHAARCLQCF